MYSLTPLSLALSTWMLDNKTVYCALNFMGNKFITLDVFVIAIIFAMAKQVIVLEFKWL